MPTKTMDATAFQEAVKQIIPSIALAQPSPMLHEHWLRACAIGINPDGRFELVSASDGGRIVAAGAFELHGGLRPHLTLLGAEHLWFPSDLHYSDATGAAALAEALVERGLPVRFGHFPGESAFPEALKSAAAGKGLVLADQIGASPYISFDQSWREPEMKLTARRRSDMRRRLKKAKALGKVTFEFNTPQPHEVDAMLDEAISVEANSWKGRSRTALAYDTKQRAFFRNYARLASEAGIIHISFLRIDGRPVAAKIAALCHNTFWGFKTGYDEAYRSVSPGLLLFMEVMRHAACEEVTAHEFLGKCAPWMRDWTSHERPLLRLRYYPYNLAGGAAFLVDGSVAIANRVKNLVQSRTASAQGKSPAPAPSSQ